MLPLPETEEELPGQAMHNAIDTAPIVLEYLPATQLSQVEVPDNALYLPAAQAEHGPPSKPVYPELHRQAAERVCEESE